MDSSHFDVVTVGGGLGASALAAALANGGMRVLVLERETQFKDRVRGEYIVSWGVAEARELGIDDMLLRACGAEIPFVEMGFGARNLVETTPQRRGGVSFFHPDMQQALLDHAERSGATVRRGANVTGVSPGSKPAVRVDVNGREEQISARIVVVADGRGSAARKWLGFALERDECPFHFAGVSLGGVSCQEDKASFVFNPEFGLIGAVVPQKNGRFRAYLGYPADGRISLNGAENRVRRRMPGASLRFRASWRTFPAFRIICLEDPNCLWTRKLERAFSASAERRVPRAMSSQTPSS